LAAKKVNGFIVGAGGTWCQQTRPVLILSQILSQYIMIKYFVVTKNLAKLRIKLENLHYPNIILILLILLQKNLRPVFLS
jgi:hypothetical protein